MATAGGEALTVPARSQDVELDPLEDALRQDELVAPEYRALEEHDLAAPVRVHLHGQDLTPIDVALVHDAAQLLEEPLGSSLGRSRCLDRERRPAVALTSVRRTNSASRPSGEVTKTTANARHGMDLPGPTGALTYWAAPMPGTQPAPERRSPRPRPW